MPMKVYRATNMDRTIFGKLPYLFEYTNPVAQIGYYRTVYPALTSDMVLLERAEAQALQADYNGAVADLLIWLGNISKNTFELTPEAIVTAMNSVDYSLWDLSTVKKHLNPGFEIGAEGETMECMLQFILLCKRVEGLGVGQRWFDVNRYGIEIERRVIDAAGLPEKKTDKLVVRDPRRALHIPRKVLDAGYEKNPR